MEKEKFEMVMSNFNSIIKDCQDHLDKVTTTEDLFNMPLKEVIALSNYAKKEQQRQDKVFSEYRHLVGMGKLTAVQLQMLSKMFKEYSSYRSDIHTLSKHLNSLSDIPNLPTKSKYQLEVLGDFTLESEIRGNALAAALIIVENNSKEDIDETNEKANVEANTNSKFKYKVTYSNNTLTFHKDDLLEILAVLEKHGGPFKGGSIATAAIKFSSGKNYWGLQSILKEEQIILKPVKPNNKALAQTISNYKFN